jgi:hemolysin III
MGAIFAIVALILLLINSTKSHDPLRIFGFTVFGVTLIIMYLSSTLYHSLMFTKAKRVFRIIDHSSIFLLIAGSFTPLVLLTFRLSIGIWFLSIIWILAVIGIVFSVFYIQKTNILLACYLIMGWLGLLTVKPLIHHEPIQYVILMITGGLLYSTGTIFYKWRKLAFHHGIWHLFVISATICHFMTVIHL